MRHHILLTLAFVAALTSCARQQTPDASPAATTIDEHASHTMAAPTAATAQAGPLVTFASAEGNGSGYLSAPRTSGRKPALIVIHEWWGLDNWIREQTDRFSGNGYVALAVDLYRGKVAATSDEAHELSRGLPEDRAMADLKAAFNYLASRPDVDPQRIGVIGWCMGGGYALGLATQEPRLAATSINYGRLVTDPATIAKINSPIVGSFGALDRGIPPASVTKFEEALKAAGKVSDIKIYDGAGHAFMNPNNKNGYNEAAARDAWSRIDRFFDTHLRAKIPNS